MDSIKGALWAGSINTRVVYGLHEYLITLHRSSYLPLYYQRLAHYFSVVTLTPSIESLPIWVQYKSTPLKWNLPIGVLHDMLNLGEAEKLPIWTLTLVVPSADTPYPLDLIPFPSPVQGELVNYTDAVFQVIMNQLKQSCYVLKGNSRVMLSMSEQDTRSLWKAIKDHDYDKYQSIMKTFSAIDAPRRIPIRAYHLPSCSLTQLSVTPLNSSDSPTTLGEALQEIQSKPKEAYIQGINGNVLLTVEVLEVWRLFRHLDNFLYILII